MLRKIRIVSSAVFFLLITMLFLDFTGTLHLWFGWLVKVQLIPAILALNVGVVLGLLLLTILFGRIYCSVICPLGVFQDGVSNLSGKRKGKKNRFKYASPKLWCRYGVLLLFVLAIVFDISALISILDPYAAYGRIASNIVAPIYQLGNNLLASIAENVDSYAFYSTEVWMKGWITLGIALVTLVIVGILAWRNGRTYCNTICPVGTILGLVSKISIFRPTFDSDKCNSCGLCAHKCKASCIDIKTKQIDYSRCVTCFNCVDKCKSGAMKYAPRKIGKKKEAINNLMEVSSSNDGLSRRSVLSLITAFAFANIIKAQQVHVDGGLAEIEDKQIPNRKIPIVPPGAGSAQHLKNHCTACQLCVSACPNHILLPSNTFETLMQPHISFERGYCRPECTECSQVCPTSAIKPITAADKTGIAIGYAVWIKDNCVVNTDEVQCNNCQRHCPTGAITQVELKQGEKDSLKIPVVNRQLCIGCGACENLCPARPFAAIYVEGNVRHHAV